MTVQNKKFTSETGFQTSGFTVSEGLLRVSSLETNQIAVGQESSGLSIVNGVITLNSKAGPSGAINNIAIGAVTPAAGSFTSLTANTSVNFTTTGSIVINPSSTGSLNNVTIGLTTPRNAGFIDINTSTINVQNSLTTKSLDVGISFTPTLATYTPTTGVMTITIGSHNLQAGDTIFIAPYSLTFTCALDNNETLHSYPRPFGVPNSTGSDPFFGSEITIDSVTPTTITINVGISSDTSLHTFVNAKNNSIVAGTLVTKSLIANNLVIPSTGTLTVGSSFTATNAVYTPTTGNMVITIGTHNLQIGDAIYISPYSLTFTCGLDGNSSLHSYPRSANVPNTNGTDPAFNSPIIVINRTTTTITVNVGISSDTSIHNFVSAVPNSITVGSFIAKNVTTTNLKSNNTTVNDVVIVNGPTLRSHGTRKDYVDATATALAIALGG